VGKIIVTRFFGLILKVTGILTGKLLLQPEIQHNLTFLARTFAMYFYEQKVIKIVTGTY